MKRLWILALVMIAVLGLAVPPALAGKPNTAGSVSPAKLVKAGWDCISVFEAMHCSPPGGLARVLDESAKTMTFLVFDTDDPTAEDAPFLGTEIVIRGDIFHGQPCPTDPPGEYTYLPDEGLNLDYWACHHYDSSF